MGTIEKGTIASLNTAKNTARVQTKAGIVTNDLVIPWHLRGDSGNLAKGMEVVFVEFDDQTGILLGRAGITAAGDVKAGTVSLQKHTNNYTWGHDPGSGTTGAPNG